MPRGDGTGPAGMGPMTGRAAGFCAGYPVPGYMNPAGGRGFWGSMLPACRDGQEPDTAGPSGALPVIPMRRTPHQSAPR
jgi:hypothetical protein